MEKIAFEPYQVTCSERTLTIRRAENNTDLVRIPQLERSYFYESKKGDTGHVYDEGEVLDLNPHGEFFLVEKDNELVGYTSVVFGKAGNPKISTTEGDAYYAGSLLKPEYRRNGLSKDLNELREQRALLYGSRRAITCLVANNRGSIAALTKAGFIISKTVRSVFSPNESVSGDRLVMTKDLLQNAPLVLPSETVAIPLEKAQHAFEIIHRLLESQRSIVGQCLSEDFTELILKLK